MTGQVQLHHPRPGLHLSPDDLGLIPREKQLAAAGVLQVSLVPIGAHDPCSRVVVRPQQEVPNLVRHGVGKNLRLGGDPALRDLFHALPILYSIERR